MSDASDYEFGFSREKLVRFLNSSKVEFLNALVREGIITDEQGEEASKYVLGFEQPGNYGPKIGDIYDVRKEKTGKEYFSLVISKLLHADLVYNNIDLPQTNPTVFRYEYSKDCECNFTPEEQGEYGLTINNDKGDYLCTKCNKPWNKIKRDD